MSDYKALASQIGAKLKTFRSDIPETMKGFGLMAGATHADGALTAKSKELMAMAIAIAMRCQGCLAFHAQACRKMGVTQEEFNEMLQVAIYMGGGPSVMTAAEAQIAFDQFAA